MSHPTKLPLILLSLIVVLLAGPLTAQAQVPVVPCMLYGTVTLDGQKIPDEMVVTAWIGDLSWEGQRWSDASASYYSVTVPGDDLDTPEKDGGVPGDIITFKVDAYVADQTAPWINGLDQTDFVLNLTASRGTATPTVTGTLPTATPTRTSTPTRTPTATPTNTSTSTRTLSPTATNTATTPTATPHPTTTTLRDAAVQDTYLDSDFSGDNFATAGRLKAKYYSKRPLFRFDLESQVPAGSRILSAFLQVYTTVDRYPADPVRSLTVEVYGVRRPWVLDEVSWNNVQSGVRWQIPGADDTFIDRDSTPTDVKVVSQINASYTFDVTALVQRWTNDPAANYGLIMVGTGQSVEYRFYSSEEFNANLRPKLTVTFIPPPPTPTRTATPTNTLTPSTTPTPTASHTPTLTATPTRTPTTGAIRAIAWEDKNGNKVADPEEPRVAGVIILVSRYPSGVPIEGSCQTTASGECLVDLLTPGTYFVSAVAPAGFEITFPPGGKISLPVSAGSTMQVGIILRSIYTPTVTRTATRTATGTATATATSTASGTATNTPTVSATPTETRTPTITGTPTWTATFTNTPTRTATVTPTTPGAPTPTFTRTATATPRPLINPQVTPASCGLTYWGDTANGASYASNYSCSECGFLDYSGPEVVYVLTTTVSVNITATLDYNPGLANLDVLILNALDPRQCAVCGDRVAVWRAMPPGVHYIVVDGLYGGHTQYTLRLECPGGPTPTNTPQATRTPTATPTSTPRGRFLPLVIKPPAPTPTPTWTPTFTPTPTPTMISYDLATNCAGPLFVDSAGVTWMPDQPFTGGNTWGYIRHYPGEGDVCNPVPIKDTADDTLYQCNRVSADYVFRVPAPGLYHVQLKFAEITTFYCGPKNPRVFDVLAEGSLLLENLNVYQAAGCEAAFDAGFEIAVNDGQLDLQFRDRPDLNSYSMVAAIRVTHIQ